MLIEVASIASALCHHPPSSILHPSSQYLQESKGRRDMEKGKSEEGNSCVGAQSIAAGN